MAKLVLACAALLLCLGLAAANEGCVDAITGYSGTFGKRAAGRADRFNNQTTQWRSKGAISKVNVYFSANQRCLVGLKVTYGYDARNARLLGVDAGDGISSKDLMLAAGEQFNKAQLKADGCVEYLRLTTNQGRALEIGNADSPLQTVASYPNRATGFLAAVRGYEEYAKAEGGATARGPLKTLQMVWANCNAEGGAIPAPADAAPPTSGADAPAEPAAEPAAEAAAPAAAPAPAAEDAAAAPVAPASAGCPALQEMCSPEASATATSFCPVVAPFKSSQCLGGCCFSSGKCTSSSCAISGLGKEAPNTICYGLNPAVAIGASPSCRGLACKLAVPGCTSDLLGGSCVGTVVDPTGAAEKSPAAAALVGMPCLDVTPSDKTLTKDGALSKSGEFVAKLWSVCDCKAPAADKKEGFLSGLPKLGKVSAGDLKALVDVLKGANATTPLQHAVGALRSKIPGLVAPDGSASTNLTNALGALSLLLGGEGGAAAAAAEGAADGGNSQLGAVLNLLKGAGSLAAAANRTTGFLGALPKVADAAAGVNKSNPLASLGSLVAAVSPKGSAALENAEKGAAAAQLLNVLSKGAGNASPAEIAGPLSKLMQGVEGNQRVQDALNGALGKFNGQNTTDILKTLLAAASQGAKEGAGAGVNVNDLLARAAQFVAKAGGGGGDVAAASAPADGAPADTASVSQLLNGAQALAKDAQVGLAGLQAAAKDGTIRAAGLMNALKIAGGEGGAPAFTAETLAAAAQRLGPLLQAAGRDGAAEQLQHALSGLGINADGMKALGEAAQKAAPLLRAAGQRAGQAFNKLQKGQA